MQYQYSIVPCIHHFFFTIQQIPVHCKTVQYSTLQNRTTQYTELLYSTSVDTQTQTPGRDVTHIDTVIATHTALYTALHCTLHCPVHHTIPYSRLDCTLHYYSCTKQCSTNCPMQGSEDSQVVCGGVGATLANPGPGVPDWNTGLSCTLLYFTDQLKYGSLLYCKHNWNIQYLDGVAPLITDPPLTDDTPLSDFF